MRNWGVVGCVFAVVSCAIAKTALVRLAQQGVEWLVLPSAHVQRGQLETDDPLQSLHRVCALTRRDQLGARMGPKVDNTLDGGPVLKNFDWERNVRN